MNGCLTGYQREHLPVCAQICASPNGKLTWATLRISNPIQSFSRSGEQPGKGFEEVERGSLWCDPCWRPRHSYCWGLQVISSFSLESHVRLGFKGCCWTGLETSMWPPWLVTPLSMMSPGSPRTDWSPLSVGCGRLLRRWHHLRSRYH